MYFAKSMVLKTDILIVDLNGSYLFESGNVSSRFDNQGKSIMKLK